MHLNKYRLRVVSIFILIAVLGGYAIGPSVRSGVVARAGSPQAGEASASISPMLENVLYLPQVSKYYPWDSPFGVESQTWMGATSTVYIRSKELGIKWVRMNERISWRLLQPDEKTSVTGINWALLANFDLELENLKAAGMAPIVIVDDYPAWATETRDNGTSSNCGPMLESKYGAFASFMRELVKRYGTKGVQVWELGNEIDVERDAFPGDSQFGCWGNQDDPYYGGEAYGRMLMQVTPVIRNADPTAQVWIGGLLLNSPNTVDGHVGKPENFLEGILRAGAASSFDMIPYHVYLGFINQTIDHDNGMHNVPGFPDSDWYTWGGATVGKARFLRSVMAKYGVDKPLIVNEMGMVCPEYWAWCTPPGPAYYDMQANFLVRMMIRGLNENIEGFVWYTIDGPGWRYTGLLDGTEPTPAFYAYKYMNDQLRYSRFLGAVSYNVTGIEAYGFLRDNKQIHLLWTQENTTAVVRIPQSKFVEARTRDGEPIVPTGPVSGFYEITIGFEPVYITRLP